MVVDHQKLLIIYIWQLLITFHYNILQISQDYFGLFNLCSNLKKKNFCIIPSKYYEVQYATFLFNVKSKNVIGAQIHNVRMNNFYPGCNIFNFILMKRIKLLLYDKVVKTILSKF